MKLRRDVILEVDEENIIGREYSSNLLNKLKKIANGVKESYELKTLNNLQVDIKRRKIYVIVEGEEVYIKKFMLPNVKSSLLKNMIKDELGESFISLTNIVFSYKVIRKLKNSIEVIVFCLNSDKIDRLKNIIQNNNKLASINLIQFYFLNYYKNKIIVSEYIFILQCDKLLYLIACKNNIILANAVIKNLEKEDIFKDINEFINNSLNLSIPNKFVKVYFSNIDNKEIIKKAEPFYDCVDFGYVNKELVFIHYANKNK